MFHINNTLFLFRIHVRVIFQNMTMVISIHSFSCIYYFLRSNLRQIALNCFQIDVDPVMGLRTLCWGIQKEFCVWELTSIGK